MWIYREGGNERVNEWPEVRIRDETNAHIFKKNKNIDLSRISQYNKFTECDSRQMLYNCTISKE